MSLTTSKKINNPLHVVNGLGLFFFADSQTELLDHFYVMRNIFNFICLKARYIIIYITKKDLYRRVHDQHFYAALYYSYLVTDKNFNALFSA